MSLNHFQRSQQMLNMEIEPVVPTNKDVLCGPGQERGNHPGNEHFKAVVSKYVQIYANTKTKKEKMSLTKTILDELSGSGVRFLKKHPFYHQWFVADPKVGRDKIGHFLRDNYNKPDSSGGSISDGPSAQEDSVASVSASFLAQAILPTEAQHVHDVDTPLGLFLSHERSTEYSITNQGDPSSIWQRQKKVSDDLNQNFRSHSPTTSDISGFSQSRKSDYFSKNDATSQSWPRYSDINSEIGQSSITSNNKNQDFVPMTKDALMRASTFRKSEGPLFSSVKSAPSFAGMDIKHLQNITDNSQPHEFRQSLLSSRHIDEGPSDNKSYNFQQENSQRVGSSSSSSASSNNSGANFRGFDLISPSVQSMQTDEDDVDEDDDVSLFDDSELAQRLDW